MKRVCSCGSELCTVEVSDGYGIFLFYACDECLKQKLSHYRADIMQRYDCDEPIEEE